MDASEREAAVAAAEQTCPRCGAARERRQEYCVECGLRLPVLTGPLAALRRGWMRRLGWYPGDWVWVSLVTLAVAVAGAAGAIAISDGAEAGGTTLVETSGPATVTAPVPPVATTPPPTVAPEPAGGTTTTAPSPAEPRPGRTVWPAGRSGWTIVLLSYPASGGRASPLATAARAARAGLPDVGVLDSSDYASLHPGYYVVFSGIYTSRADAEAALRTAHASGFGGAYVREVAS